jgi:hypothetical protein
MPVMAASPAAEISTLMAGGMKPLLPEEAQSAVVVPVAQKKPSLLRRFGKH